MISEYQAIRQFMASRHIPSSRSGDAGEEWEQRQAKAAKLHDELVRRLPVQSRGTISKLSRKVCKELKQLQTTADKAGTEKTRMKLANIDELVEEMKGLPKDDVCRELLQSAHVIFCTLSSAGATLFKWTSKIDDLIVDEASGKFRNG
jgi:superfamily I DNA/RNA helicase